MRKFNVIICCILTMLIFTFSCSTNEEPGPEEILDNSKTLKRPNLAPGESNAKDKSGANSLKVVGNLMTEDLNTISTQDLVDALVGSGPDAPIISNVTFSGMPVAAGTFSGGTDIIGFEEGIILSSGDINSIPGPNLLIGTSTDNGLGGDADLNTLIPGYSTFDATILEFDFTCSTTQILSFQYVFSSEEYNEWVGSQFNDVFAFFLNGENIALVPNTATAVAINSVNNGANNLYYIDNTAGIINTEMDGLTVVLTASAALQPGTNHIKLAIADAGDRVLDSNVFIKGESFVCAAPTEEVDIDIHPTSCPNPLPLRAKGVMPISINGSADFDVMDIDVSTITLEGVAPLMHSYADVSTPFETSFEEPLDEYSCHTLGEDGYTDLTLKFDNEAIRDAIGPLEQGDKLVLTISGQLNDGTDFNGADIVIVH